MDAIGPVEKISLILHTFGGNISAAWNLVNLIHMFCEEFEVIVPAKCMSAGTLIALGADRIIMTKQGTLGPIDPSIQHQLGPSIPGANPEARAGVSVEDVEGYLDAIRACKGSRDSELQAIKELSDKVHPLVLGKAFRLRKQIRDLAHRLLGRDQSDELKNKKIIEFLCSDSGSHDYTINRREAVKLGLKVDKCSVELYELLKNVRESYSASLKLTEPYVFEEVQPGNYGCTRALIESADYGANHFLSMGTRQLHQQPNVPVQGIIDIRTFEGWRKIK